MHTFFLPPQGFFIDQSDLCILLPDLNNFRNFHAEIRILSSQILTRPCHSWAQQLVFGIRMDTVFFADLDFKNPDPDRPLTNQRDLNDDYVKVLEEPDQKGHC